METSTTDSDCHPLLPLRASGNATGTMTPLDPLSSRRLPGKEDPLTASYEGQRAFDDRDQVRQRGRHRAISAYVERSDLWSP